MERRAQQAIVHEVTKSQTRLKQLNNNNNNILWNNHKICLINIHHHTVINYYFVVRTSKIHSPSKFQIYHTVLLTRVTMLYIPARRSNQSILKEISPGISLEGMMLKLRLQYFGHLMWRVDSLEKTLMLGGMGVGGEGDNRGWDGWMASLTRWTWVSVNSGGWWWTERPGVLRFMGLQRVGHDWVTDLIILTCVWLFLDQDLGKAIEIHF